MAYKRDIRSIWASDEKRRTEAANITPGRFGGTTFTTGAEIDRENVQRRSLETLTAKGEQDRLFQDNAASIAQSRKNQLDVDAIYSEQAGPSMAEQRKDFMSMYAELEKEDLGTFDADGNPQRRNQAQILQAIRDRNLAFEQSQNKNKAQPNKIPGQATVERTGGEQKIIYPSGEEETSTPLSRATSKMSESFSNEEELRKRGSVSTPVSVERPPIIGGQQVPKSNALRAYNKVSTALSEKVSEPFPGYDRTSSANRDYWKDKNKPESLTEIAKRLLPPIRGFNPKKSSTLSRWSR